MHLCSWFLIRPTNPPPKGPILVPRRIGCKWRARTSKLVDYAVVQKRKCRHTRPPQGGGVWFTISGERSYEFSNTRMRKCRFHDSNDFLSSWMWMLCIFTKSLTIILLFTYYEQFLVFTNSLIIFIFTNSTNNKPLLACIDTAAGGDSKEGAPKGKEFGVWSVKHWIRNRKDGYRVGLILLKIKILLLRVTNSTSFRKVKSAMRF